ncbi:hypothetical protein ABH922_001349 [Rhodococcus sp. 27YEA15]|uniref:hypothetical protein n=1 Tax=Rhodococcus sp. 27YEA15 TaxID=3156259 RepID=UPI003C7E05AF
MDRIANWWDGFELWMAGLPFIPQVALMLVVLVPLCRLVAAVLDRALAALLALPPFGWLRENSTEAEEN